MKLSEVLLRKAREQELSHFYILEPSRMVEDAPEKLLEWVHLFIRGYYQDVEKQKSPVTHLMDHPDVLLLGHRDDEKKESAFYSVTESEELTRFFEYRAVQSKRKFAVIPDAHRINAIVANKWLKLLEEPPLEATIFILNPRKLKLLDTIHSRALHLTLPLARPAEESVSWDDLLGDAKAMTLAEFLENYSKGETPLRTFMDELLRWEAQKNDRPGSKEALAKLVKDFEEMEIFHQPSATKWTFFYSHLKEHVLPRV